MGSGVGEFAGVALEMLYQVDCIEIRSYYATVLEQKLKYQFIDVIFLILSLRIHDVLVMGDVIEHFSEPFKALEKASKLLDEGICGFRHQF